MIELSEKQWKELPESSKRTCKRTRRRQYLWDNTSNPHVEEIWITEGFNFIVFDKEGIYYANQVNN